MTGSPEGSDGGESDVMTRAADAIVDKAALMNKNLLEGVRGFLIILVMIDHFAWNNIPLYGYRLSCDTYLFILLSGFTTLLQDFSPFEIFDKKPQLWDWRTFVASKWVGLFPMYWLAIILAIPRLVIAKNYVISSGQMTPSQYGTLMALYILGLNTWDKQQNDIAHDLYFVSLIWSVFLIFTIVKLIHHNSTHIAYRALGYLCVAGTLYGISFYYAALVGPISGTAYFTFGAFLAFAYKNALLYICQNDQTYDHLSSQSNSDTEMMAPSTIVAVKNDKNESGVLQGQETLITSSSRSSQSNIKPVHVLATAPSSRNTEILSIIRFYAFKHLPDALIAIFLFVIFYTGYPRNSKSFNYNVFDNITFLLFGPVLFALILFIALLQTNPEQRSIWTKLCETNLFLRLGKCSLAIYIFQILFVDFYYATIVEWIELGVFPWTIPYEDGPFYANQYWSYGQPWWVTLIGVLLTIAASVAIQEKYQEKWVMNVYLNSNLRCCRSEEAE